MLKKLIFCLIILNTLTVWADFSPETMRVINKESSYSLSLNSPKIAEKWGQLTDVMFAPMRQQQEKIKRHSQLNKEGLSIPTLRLSDFFLKECN